MNTRAHIISPVYSHDSQKNFLTLKNKRQGGCTCIKTLKHNQYSIEFTSKDQIPYEFHYYFKHEKYGFENMTPTQRNIRLNLGKTIPKIFIDLPADTLNQAVPNQITQLGTTQQKILNNIITQYEILTWRGQRKLDTNPNQGRIKKGYFSSMSSATKTAENLGFAADSTKKGYQWLHLVAYSLGGHDGFPQYPANLVLGTWQANCVHRIIEKAVIQIIEATSICIKIDAVADTYIGSVIGKNIRYTLSSAPHPNCSISFDIDCMTRTLPTDHEAKLIHGFIATKLLPKYQAHKYLSQYFQVSQSPNITKAPYPLIKYYHDSLPKNWPTPEMWHNGFKIDHDKLFCALNKQHGGHLVRRKTTRRKCIQNTFSHINFR